MDGPSFLTCLENRCIIGILGWLVVDHFDRISGKPKIAKTSILILFAIDPHQENYLKWLYVNAICL